MAGMRDPLTEAPPPSRFDPDELNSFAPTDFVDLPPPFIVWAPAVRAQLQSDNLKPQLLILALSKVSIQLLHHLPNKTSIGSILLPGSPMIKNAVQPNPQDRTCFLYSCSPDLSVILVSVQYQVPAESSYIWTKILFEAIQAERVLVLEHTPIHHFRGKLSVDEPTLFMLATDQQKLEDEQFKPVAPYYPSGSLVDGLAAALLTHCQIRALKGRLLLTWPSDDAGLVQMLIVTLTDLLKMLPRSSGVNFVAAGKSFTTKKPIPMNDLYI